MKELTKEEFTIKWIESTNVKIEGGETRQITRDEFNEAHTVVRCDCDWPSCVGWLAIPSNPPPPPTLTTIRKPKL